MSADESLLAPELSPVGDAVSSPADPLAALKGRISQRLVAELEAQPKYMYEDDDIVQLHEQSTDKAEQLLFGNVFDVENEWYENSGDYHYLEDKRVAAEQLSSLLDDAFQADIQAVAEQLGMDAEDLTEDLRKDDDFEPQSLSWSGHFTTHKYRGSVAAYADLDLILGIEPTNDMFAALRLLRIKPKDFLSAVRSKMLADGADADNAAQYDLSESEVEVADGSLYGAYRARFKRQLARAEVRFGYCHAFSEAPVVDVHELVEKILDEWTSPANLYVNLALDADTVDDVSAPLCRMDSPHKAVLNFRVTSGYICDDSRADVSGCSIEIKSPFEVPRSAMKVNKESPDRGMAGGLELAPRERAYSALYHLSVLDETVKDLDRSDPESRRKVAEAIEQVVSRLPAHALVDARNGAAVRPWGDENDKAVARWINEIATEVIDARERTLIAMDAGTKGAQLLAILNQRGTFDCAREQALWLIKHGADVNVVAGNGYTPALLAANQRDVELLSALYDAGARIAAVREVQMDGLADNGLSLALRAGAKAAKKDGQPNLLAAADWLLEHGVAPLNSRVLASSDDLSFAHAAYLALDYKDAGFFSRLLGVNAEHVSPGEHQKLVDALFVRAVTEVAVGPGSALIEHGADLNVEIAHVRGRSGKGPAEEVLEHIGGSSSIYREDAKQFQQMVQAARAKRSIEGVLQKARSSMRPS